MKRPNTSSGEKCLLQPIGLVATRDVKVSHFLPTHEVERFHPSSFKASLSLEVCTSKEKADVKDSLS